MASTALPRRSSRSNSLLRTYFEQERKSGTLASCSSHSCSSQQTTTTIACEQSDLPGPSRTTPREIKRAFGRSSRASWMLRSFLVLVLLAPFVSTMPSGVSDARRQGMGSVSARGFSQPQTQQREVASAFNTHGASSRPGYLGRDGASSVQAKQRIADQSTVRRDDVFPAVVAVDSAIPSESVADTLTVVFTQDNGTSADLSVAAPPTKRWGQTATYLSSHNLVLVVGGQTSLAGDITNDVYALDVADMSAASLTSNSTAQSWQRLSSEGLPAHAYAAASAMFDPVDGLQKLWIVGGVTQNCAVDAPAYVWSAPVGNVTAGRWTAVYSDTGLSPQRRRGAEAVTLASNGTSIMVLGGTFDTSTCAQTNGTYAGIDMWSQLTLPSTTTSSTMSMGINTAVSYATIRSLALDPRMHNLPLSDYTAVTLPATPTCDSKVLFLGGKTASGSLAPLSTLWALDTTTGNWEHWTTTGLIPSGRMAHTAVVSNGTVLIHGGYLQDPTQFRTNNDPIDEVFVLDPAQSPARWESVKWTEWSSRPPAVAYHSAVVEAGVMMISFGKASDGVGEYAGQSFAAGEGSGQVHFLDTATMQSGMTWSTSMQGVAQARLAVAANAKEPVVSSIASSVQAPAATTAPAASSSVELPVSTSSVASLPVTTAESTPPSNTNDSQSTPPPAKNHTGAIAGSLLGAAAVAAAIGGIYAYRKRKEAAAYNQGARDTLDADHDEEKGVPRGPYVSNLYLRPDELYDVPLSSSTTSAAVGAGVSGWGARLKRAASSLTKSNAADRYTEQAKPVTMRSTAPRTQMRSATDLPDHFITSLVDDESPHGLPKLDSSPRVEEDEKMMHHLNASHLSFATVSSLHSATSGEAAASHFSYPYLSGMHRGTSPRSARIIIGSPSSYTQTDMRMSPGDVVSPYHLPYNPHASPESLFLDFGAATDVAVDGLSGVDQGGWNTSPIVLPPKARVNTKDAVEMNRSMPTSLRITNAC